MMLDTIVIMLTGVTFAEFCLLFWIVWRFDRQRGSGRPASWCVILLGSLVLQVGTALLWYFAEVWGLIPLSYSGWRKLLYWVIAWLGASASISAMLFPKLGREPS